MPRIAVYSAKDYDRASLKRHSPGKEFQWTFINETISTKNVKLGYDYCCVFVNDLVDKTVINKMAKAGVKGILCRCAGFDRVDVKYAIEKKIPVMRVPAYSPHAVAEHATTLLMMANRNMKLATHRVSGGNFDLGGLVGMDVHGKTVGILGTGRIGQIFAKIMIGFGASIAAYDMYENAEFGRMPEVTYMTQDEVFARADIISLHLPLFDSTRHVICKANIKKMKRGVMIVNSSRGALVKTGDLIDGLNRGQIRAAGLDVYEHEKDVFFNHHNGRVSQDGELCQLLGHPNVVLSGHQAFLTDEALDAIAKTTIYNIQETEANRPAVNTIQAAEVLA